VFRFAAAVSRRGVVYPCVCCRVVLSVEEVCADTWRSLLGAYHVVFALHPCILSLLMYGRIPRSLPMHVCQAQLHAGLNELLL
jgi:hypothetical protein